jgi:Ni,Fe-hydrogenase III small subunit
MDADAVFVKPEKHGHLAYVACSSVLVNALSPLHDIGSAELRVSILPRHADVRKTPMSSGGP